LKLHAKMVLIDKSRVIVGSINLAPGSFDSRRELAIGVSDESVIERMTKVAHHDWKNSSILDLTDEGLLAELERHNIEAADELAIKDDRKKSGHKKHKK
jgi:cardiolipin synthase A/B